MIRLAELVVLGQKGQVSDSRAIMALLFISAFLHTEFTGQSMPVVIQALKGL